MKRFFPTFIALAATFSTASSQAEVVNLAPVADTFIASGNPDNNAGGHPFFDAGTDGVGGVRRGLLRFNVAGAIPAGSTINSAILRLTVVKLPPITVDSTMELYRLLAAWGEGDKVGNNGLPGTAGEATWEERIVATAPWTTPGAMDDALPTPSASAAVGSALNEIVAWSGPALASDVQFWLANSGQNFGWLLVCDAEATPRSVRAFGSREGGGAAAPSLEVNYTPPPPPNTPPSVTITNPPTGTVYTTIPATVTIEATATDSNGSVTQVEFFDGANSLGVDPFSPYSVSTSFPYGDYRLTAVATDNLGAKGTSAVVNISVRTPPVNNPIAERIPKGDITIELRTIADGMISPLGMAVPDDGSGRIFVYDQVGLVWLVTSAGRSPSPVLDLRGRLVNISGGYDERGLLGLATHPNFAQNPLIYTYTSEFTSGPADFPSVLNPGTVNNHQSVITEWRLNPSTANVIDPATRREVMRIDQPQSNHNGGTMRFGPDGMLYVTLGDGGAADDQGNGHSPTGNGQDLTTILGKIIRINVDARTSANGQYGVPADNPFIAGPGVDEIWAYGLRNPFSFSFDRADGTLYLGDVGQNRIEEIDIITRGGNYGWNIKEGSFYFDPNGSGAGYVSNQPIGPVPPGLIDPIAQYDRDDGTAVIGGYLYRGSQVPSIAGRYVFGDWGVFGSPSGRLYYLDANSAVKEFRIGLDDRPLGLYLKGFGEDAAGELYVFASEPQGPQGLGGIMYKIVPPPASGLVANTPAVVNGTNIQISWSGGIGPFQQQRKIDLNEPLWLNETNAAGNSATVPRRGQTGFFRHLDTAQQRTVGFTALLNGANERPTPVSPAGDGFAILMLEGNSLTFTITYRNLTSGANNAHIHGPAAAGGATGVLIDLRSYHNTVALNGSTSGSFSGTVVLTDAQKAHLLSGKTYVNVHSGNNPGGEIRGQITPIAMHCSLLGAAEIPPVNTLGRGFGSFALVGNQLTFNISYRDLTGPASMAHIHGPAPEGQDAGIMIDLQPFNGGAYGSSGFISGSVALTPAQLAAVVDGLTYVNFHTAAHGPGEIRGQILPQSTAVAFTSQVSGLNERPNPHTNSAGGIGLYSLEGDTLAFNIVYSGLSGNAIGGHIHGPGTTTNSSPVVIDLAPYHLGPLSTQGIYSGVIKLSPAQRNMLLNGQAYFNVHTGSNPTGEARGHIAAVLMSTGASGPGERPTPIVSTGSAVSLFTLVSTNLNLNVVYKGLSSAANAAHIHAPATANQSTGIAVDLAPFNGGAYGVFGSLTGSTNLTTTIANHIIDTLSYINFHTPANQSGEIRGQLTR